MLKSSTILFVLAGAAALLAAFDLGIGINPRGTMLLYVAIGSLVMAFASRWSEPGSFVNLLIASVMGFPIAGLLYNAANGLGDRWGLPLLENEVSAVFFFVAVIVCPVGVIVGAAGAVATTWRDSRRQSFE